MKIAYTGPSHFRTITKKQLRDAELPDDVEVKLVNKDFVRRVDINKEKLSNEVEVSDEVGNYLLENEPKQWRVVKDAEPAAGDTTGDASSDASASSATGNAKKASTRS